MYNGQVMTVHDYRMDLIVEPTDYGFISRVRSSPVGPASASFDLSITRRQLSELHIALQSASISEAFEQNLLSEELRSWGHRLFDALFFRDVLECFRASKKMADDAGNELRLHLDLTEMEELAQLPWEFLFDSYRQEFVALSAGTLYTRYFGMMQRLLPPKRESELRALVVIPSPAGYPETDVQRQWLSLVDSVDYLARDGKLVVELLHKPTLFDLQKQLREGAYDILHIIGHGIVDPATSRGQMLFEDEMGRVRTVAGDHLGSLLRDQFAMRLVLLTGGDVATPEHAGNGFIDVAQRLVQRGMGAVMAMPTHMPLEARTAFLGRFYSEIAEITPVDKAATLARSTLRENHFWWGAPVLITRSPDGNLFDDSSSEKERLTEIAEDNIAFRLSALRIRTATEEEMTHWSDEINESRIKRRIERD